MLSAKSSSYVPESYNTIKIKEQQKAYQEYLRLLYVAMTRAEDQLVICGYQSKTTIPENCWYQLIKNSMERTGSLDANNNLVYGNLSTVLAKEDYLQKSKSEKSNEDKIFTIHAYEKLKKDIYKTFTNTENKIFHNNYLSVEYGAVFHKILEDIVGNKNLEDASNHPLIQTLNANLQKKVKNSLKKLISNHQFQELLKYPLKTEVSFGYKVNSEINFGRVDLIIIQEHRIIIIDYKSDKKSYTDSLPNQYIDQLQLYKKAFTEIYPDKIINCKIIWLESGNIQDIENFNE